MSEENQQENKEIARLLRDILARIDDIRQEIKDHAVVLGELKANLEHQKLSLERNWKQTEDIEERFKEKSTDIEHRLRQVEAQTTTLTVKMTFMAGGVSMFTSLLLEVAKLLIHK